MIMEIIIINAFYALLSVKLPYFISCELLSRLAQPLFKAFRNPQPIFDK